jgi:hypothetical protein
MSARKCLHLICYQTLVTNRQEELKSSDGWSETPQKEASPKACPSSAFNCQCESALHFTLSSDKACAASDRSIIAGEL